MKLVWKMFAAGQTSVRILSHWTIFSIAWAHYASASECNFASTLTAWNTFIDVRNAAIDKFNLLNLDQSLRLDLFVSPVTHTTSPRNKWEKSVGISVIGMTAHTPTLCIYLHRSNVVCTINEHKNDIIRAARLIAIRLHFNNIIRDQVK